MLVSDILDEVKEILGRCDNPTVFRRLTDAIKLANNQIKDFPNIGQMDLCVCDGCVTLPADVAQVLKVNRGGQPTVIRDHWFSYSVGGPGITEWMPWGYTDELGRVCTYRDPDGPVKLVAVVENSSDSNKALRVFGYDDTGKRIYTAGPNNTLEDGFLVPTAFGYPIPHPTAPAISRIDRIIKDVTTGFVRLVAVDPISGSIHTQIGYYLPWETIPSYRRVRVDHREWIRIKYRRTDIEVRGVQDWINIDNREGLLLLLKAVKYRRENQFDVASSAEKEGIRLLLNEARANHPPGLHIPQVMDNSYPDTHEGLIY